MDPAAWRMGRLGRAIAARPVPVLAATLAVVAVLGVAGLRLGVDPGNEALFLTHDPARASTARFNDLFASDQTIVVALRGPVLTERGLARLERLREAVARIPHVASALALTNARNIYPGPVEAYGWAPYEWVKDEEKTVAEFAAEVLAEPLFAGNLISADGRMGAIICEVRGRDVAVVEALRAAARAEGESAAEGFEAFVAGQPVERIEFAETIQRDQGVFVPLIVVTLAILMALLFRQLWGVALPLAVVGASIASTMGIAALAGIKLNAVSSMLTPVVMVVSVAVSVNFLMAYAQAREERRGAPRIDAVAGAIGRVGLPCIFTTGTTAAGFGSLAIGDVPAMRDFGILCAIGVAISYFFALLLLPPLLALEWRRGPGSLHLRPGKIEELLARAAPFLKRRRRLVIAGAALAVVVSIAGAARIRVETDILAQLPKDGPLARATKAIDETLGGVNTIEVLLTGAPGTFRTLEGLRAIEGLQRWLEGQQGVAKTFSPVDLVERLNDVKRKRRGLPPDEDTTKYYFGLLDQAAKANDPLKAFLSPDAAHARLTARLFVMPATGSTAVLRGFEAEARRRLPPGITAEPTGEFVLLLNMTEALPYDMIRGLLIATVVIVGMVALLFGSLRLAALAAIPASIPILAVYGLMGWTGIWLSTATSMISSVVLGLAIDSTILFLARYRDERRSGRSRDEAVEAMLRSAGQSVTYSNLTLIFGFAVGATSRFPPIRDFGVLTSLTIAASYLGALLLLPALIYASPAGSISGKTEAP